MVRIVIFYPILSIFQNYLIFLTPSECSHAQLQDTLLQWKPFLLLFYCSISLYGITVFQWTVESPVYEYRENLVGEKLRGEYPEFQTLALLNTSFFIFK